MPEIMPFVAVSLVALAALVWGLRFMPANSRVRVEAPMIVLVAERGPEGAPMP